MKKMTDGLVDKCSIDYNWRYRLIRIFDYVIFDCIQNFNLDRTLFYNGDQKYMPAFSYTAINEPEKRLTMQFQTS